jgi:hypothetical protein
MKFSIRLLYLYLFSAIGLFIFIIGCIRLIDLGLKIYVFHDADKYTLTRPMVAPPEKGTLSPQEAEEQFKEAQRTQDIENNRNRQRETSGALAMILIGAPLYLYHWKTISKESKSSKK